MKPIYEPVVFEPILNPNFKKWIDIVNRLNGFDPSPIYERLAINPNKRRQPFGFNDVWPDVEGLCACGCGEALTGRRTRWASDACSGFAATIYCIIINGDTAGTIRNVLNTIEGNSYYDYPKCRICGGKEKIQIDHIIGVAHGGGGCWLNNFEPLCHACHVDKTNRTFGKGKYKPAPLFQQQQQTDSGEIDFGLFGQTNV